MSIFFVKQSYKLYIYNLQFEVFHDYVIISAIITLCDY